MPSQGAVSAKPDTLLERYQTLLEVSDVIHACQDLEQLFSKLVESLRRVVAFDAIAIGLIEPNNQTLRLGLFESRIRQAVDVGFTLPLSAIPAGWVIEHQQTVRVRTKDNDPRFQLHNQLLGKAGLGVSYHLPLTTSRTRLGELAFAFQSDEVELPQSELELMQHVADQVAVAIESARNFDQACVAQRELQQRDRQRELLLQLTNSVVSNLDFQEVLRAVVRGVHHVVPCAIVAVVLPDEDGHNLRLQAMHFPEGKGLLREGILVPIEGSLGGRVFKSQTPLVVNELDARNYSPEMYARVSGEGLRSQCFVPFVSRGRALGVLGVGRKVEGGFSPDDVEFLGLVANQVTIALENAFAYREIGSLKDKLAQEKVYLEEEILSGINFGEIVGESTALKAALHRVQNVAASDSTVLILGETGTGKELIARAIHDASRRKGRTFVKLNCSAIPTGLLESELFGHERGAFTGAIAQKIGRMELAHGGTLFLDEVGDIPLELQPKLLRALQEREFERLGSVRTQKSDVRFLAATNRDLQQMVADKTFRSDLFYRLNVFPITVPSLRERPDDIPRLIRYFVSKYAKKMDKTIDTIPSAAMAKLQRWPWPGNVRELENIIERSVILSRGSVLEVPLAELETPEPENGEAGATLRDNEREHILKMLRLVNGSVSEAASRLGMKRTTLQSRMKKLEIDRNELGV